MRNATVIRWSRLLNEAARMQETKEDEAQERQLWKTRTSRLETNRIHY